MIRIRIASVCLALGVLVCLLAYGCSSKEEAIRTYAMGERAEAGTLVYCVLEARWQTQLGQTANARLPRDRFLLLRVSVTNGGPNEVSVPLTSLVSSGGQTYSELTEGEGVADWMGMLRKLKPAETVFGWIVFDAPRADYHLRVSDDAFDPVEAQTALIQVPVRLEGRSDFLPETKQNR